MDRRPTRDELHVAVASARAETGAVVYVERRGDRYRWGDGPSGDPAGGPPEAWIFFTGEWLAGDTNRWPAFFDDLLAEMDSMVGGDDRCRWPLDDPWFHRH
jgi:hypothetical protein